MIALSIVLILAAVALVLLVLFQSGKSHGLSGSIAGGAETFFGKAKGKKLDAVLNKVTTFVAIGFVLILVIFYISQPDSYSVDTPDLSLGNSDYYSEEEEESASTGDNDEDDAADSSADSTDSSADSSDSSASSDSAQ